MVWLLLNHWSNSNRIAGALGTKGMQGNIGGNARGAASPLWNCCPSHTFHSASFRSLGRRLSRRLASRSSGDLLLFFIPLVRNHWLGTFANPLVMCVKPLVICVFCNGNAGLAPQVFALIPPSWSQMESSKVPSQRFRTKGSQSSKGTVQKRW